MASISKGPLSRSPHDRFFRSYFQRPDILQALAEFVLPSDLYCELDFSRFSLDTDTHVERKQSTRYSDLSATVGYRGGSEAKLYLLFEHKSWSDSWVTLQLLRYMTRIWSRHERENRRLPLPPVIPIVIYHGRSRRAHTDFATLFDEELPASLRRCCPSFRVETLNLTALGSEAIALAPPVLAAGLSALKNARAGIRKLLAPIDRLVQRWGTQLVGDRNFDILIEYMSYLAPGDPSEFAADIGQMVDSVLLQEEIVSVGEKLVEQGRKEGRDQGLQEGRLKRAREDALRMLSKGYPVEDIVEITELSREEVEALAENRENRE